MTLHQKSVTDMASQLCFEFASFLLEYSLLLHLSPSPFISKVLLKPQLFFFFSVNSALPYTLGLHLLCIFLFFRRSIYYFKFLASVYLYVQYVTYTMCVSYSGMSDSLQPHGLYCVTLCPWNSPGKNTTVGCHSVLQTHAIYNII